MSGNPPTRSPASVGPRGWRRGDYDLGPSGKKRTTRAVARSERLDADKLTTMLVLTGEKASGDFLIQQGRLVAANVEGVVVRNSGHWLMEEAPDQVIPKLVEFLNR